MSGSIDRSSIPLAGNGSPPPGARQRPEVGTLPPSGPSSAPGRCAGRGFAEVLDGDRPLLVVAPLPADHQVARARTPPAGTPRPAPGRSRRRSPGWMLAWIRCSPSSAEGMVQQQPHALTHQTPARVRRRGRSSPGRRCGTARRRSATGCRRRPTRRRRRHTNSDRSVSVSVARQQPVEPRIGISRVEPGIVELRSTLAPPSANGRPVRTAPVHARITHGARVVHRVCVGPRPRFGDHALGRRSVLEPVGGHLVAFQILVHLEEVLDLVEQRAAACRPDRRRATTCGSRSGTHRIFSSSPFSSVMRNNPIGRTLMRQPGNVGSPTNTRASSGSPSPPRVPSMNP